MHIYSQIYEIVRGSSSYRFFKFQPSLSYRRSKEEEEKAKNVWLRGHTGTKIFSTCTYVSQVLSTA